MYKKLSSYISLALCVCFFVCRFLSVRRRMDRGKEYDCLSYPPITSPVNSHCFFFSRQSIQNSAPPNSCDYGTRVSLSCFCKKTSMECTIHGLFVSEQAQRNHCKYAANKYGYSRETTHRPAHTC